MTLCISTALSGLTATQGEKASLNVAANYVNSHYGGIAGHKVSFDLQNDSGNATTAVQEISQFVSLHASNPNDCVAEVGMDYDPSIQPSQVAVTNKAKMITVVDLSPDAYTDPAKYPYVFPMNPSDNRVGQAMGDYIASRGWKRWAVLTTGVPQETEEIHDDLAGAKAAGDDATIVQTATIPPGAVDVQTSLLKLKQSNPDVLLVMIGLGYGAVWSGMKVLGWSPNIISDLAAFYYEYNAIEGTSLAKNAVAPAWYGDIPNHPALPSNVTNLIDTYKPLLAPDVPSDLINVSVSLDRILLVKWAVEKYHSVNSDAMKRALETLNDTPIFWQGNRWTFTPTEHTGLVGPYGPGAMNMFQLATNNYDLFTYATPDGSPLASSSSLSALNSTAPIWPATSASP